MQLDDIEVLVTVAETKSLSQAAEKLYMSRPGLSQKIANIESRFGMKLYERTAAATAGVPLALLVEERCGACRTPIEHGRVVDMRSQGNVATCPNCGRLLILQAH